VTFYGAPTSTQLGAGLGLPGIVAAKCGAQEAWLTDSEQITPGTLAVANHKFVFTVTIFLIDF
jgi:predicted nicotinamide N-methyase